MAVTITLPDLGEGVESVDVVAVLVSVGDEIEVEQSLIEVETEKASVEVPSDTAGTIVEILVAEGDTLGEKAPIATIEVSEEPAVAPEKPQEETTAEVAPEGESDPFDIPETPEEQREESPEDVGQPVLEATSPPPVVRSGDMKAIPAAPTVRRFAREVGVDIAQVTGSGQGGRISTDDVKAHTNRLLAGTTPGAGQPQVSAELPDLARFGPVHREPMSKIRSLTARNLTRAWLTAPQVTNHEKADITDLESFRKASKERVAEDGGKLTMTAILVKIVASSLTMHPTLNAAIDMASSEIVFRDSVNIGVAVDTDRGLLVPVVRDANTKNLTQLAVAIDDLATRARTKKLQPDEMQGGTFSISNLGGIGGTGFSPIVNWPEVAILGVSRGRIEAEWHEGSFRPRLMLPLSLSYDHRLVDGADAARFLARVKESLEQPLLMAFEG